MIGCKRSIFIEFHKRLTDRPTNGQTDPLIEIEDVSKDILWPFYGLPWVSIVEQYCFLLFLKNAPPTDGRTDGSDSNRSGVRDGFFVFIWEGVILSKSMTAILLNELNVLKEL